MNRTNTRSFGLNRSPVRFGATGGRGLPKALVSATTSQARSMARAEHVNLQLRTWTQRNLQPNSQPPKCMVLKTVSAANEVPGYTQLQQQIHDALRAQHPEWVQPNGDSPTCDAYEWRFAELLRIRARDSATKNAPEITNSAARLARASFFARGHVPPQAPQPERDANDKFT